MPVVVIAALASYVGGAVGLMVGGAFASYLVGTVTAAIVTAYVASALTSAIGLNKKPSYSSQLKDRSRVIRSSIAEHQIVYGTTMMSGPLAFAESTGSTNEFLHMIIPLAGHECEAINSVYFGDIEIKNSDLDGSGNVISGTYSGLARIKKHLGSVTQVADNDLVAEVDNWTSDHSLQGITYVYVRIKYNPSAFPAGIPNIKAVVQGKKLYDPRTSTTLWSDNWALCIRDYIASDYGLNAESTELNDASFIAAANASDESVNIPGGGTQNRYTCNGAFSLDARPADILQQLSTAGAGAVVYSQGEYRIYAGVYSSSVASFNEDDLRADIKVRPRVSRKDLYNAVRGTYLSEDDFWQSSDFPSMANSTYADQDGGEVIYRDIELAYTNNSFEAQRIAKIHLEKSRQGITVDFPAKLTALQIAPFDTIDLTIASMGWVNKEFKVMGWRMAPEGGVDLTLQEEASASYDWSDTDATDVDPAPDTNLPDAFDIDAPTTLIVTEDLYQTRESSGVKAKAVVSYVSGDVFTETFQLEYKLTTDSEYIILPLSTALTQEILDIAPGIYDIRVKATSALGVNSSYTSTIIEILGLLARPSDITGLTISAMGGLAVLRWDIHSDLDVRVGGKINFRHAQDQSAALWQESTSIGDSVTGNTNVAVLPLKPGTYLVKAADSSGLTSVNASIAMTEGATIIEFANLTSIDEHPSFSGITINTVSVGSVLKLLGAATMDNWTTNVDNIANWDTGDGGVELSGSYDFASGIDLTTVKRVRLQTVLTSLVVNVNDIMDSKLDDIDDWEDFDGTVAAAADATIWVRTTDDDPAGTPTWGEWNRIDSSEYNNRAFDFQARLSTDDSGYNIEISELTINVDEVA